MKYLWVAAVWVVWCALHSLLISPSVAGFARRWLGGGYRYHRLFFNGFSAVTLIPVLAFGFSVGGPEVFSWSGPLRAVQGALLSAAFWLFAAGARRYDVRSFIGIRQMRQADGASCDGLDKDCGLDTGGVLGAVRHPWYTGGILVLWSRDLDVSALVTSLVLTAYLIIGAFLEERKLSMRFGEEYSRYRRRVSMFFPFKWLRCLPSKPR